MTTLCILFALSKGKFLSPTHSHSANDTLQETTSNTCVILLQGLSQERIPTGCESVSTVAALQHLRIDISIDEFINSFLPCKGFYRQDGVLFGPNPHEYFAGDPYQKASLGCYPPVIMKALSEMKNSSYPGMNNLNFKNVSGADIETLTTQYIDSQIPVILWVTIDMKVPYEGMQYYLEDGTLYTWTAGEHCTVLCGYDEDSYYLMDPLSNGEIVAHPKELVENRYNQMGKYAVVIY